MSTKTTGEFSEIAVLLEAAKYGLKGSIPFGDSLPYDLILDSGNELFRIQVKTAFLESNKKTERFLIKVNKSYLTTTGAISSNYNESDFDYLIAYVSKYNDFYIFPISIISLYKRTITIRPNKYSQYKNNWSNLKGTL